MLEREEKERERQYKKDQLKRDESSEMKGCLVTWMMLKSGGRMINDEQFASK